MSPSNADSTNADMLRDGNYFYWEFNARMKLAKKSLLDHIDATKAPQANDPRVEEWKVNDLKAFAIISTMIEPRFQSMVRNAGTAAEVWETLKNFFVQRNVHNRIQLRRELHEFKMAKGGNALDHLMKFDELCQTMAAIGDTLDDSEQLVILLGSLSEDFDQIVKIMENMSGIDVFTAKEKIRREYDDLQRKEASETALKAFQHGSNKKSGKSHGKPTKFQGKCFLCGKFGHKKEDCYSNPDNRKKQEHAFSATTATSGSWLLDSGASSHMCPAREEFDEIRPFETPVPISIANGCEVKALGTGSVPIVLSDGTLIRAFDVLWVPELDRRLISISALVAKGLSVKFERDVCAISNGDIEITRVRRTGKLFVLGCKSHQMLAAAPAEATSAELWHARLGHYPVANMKLLEKCVDGVNVSKDLTDIELCEGCANGKLAVKSFHKSPYGEIKTTGVLQLVHSDVMGPMKTVSPGGAKYVVTFIDDYSRYIFAYFMAQKSQVVDKFVEFKAMVENQLNAKIKCLRTDNGKEFVNKKMISKCVHAGIVHQTTVPYTPQQNGLAERMNRTLVERARAMLEHMQVAKKWWAEALNTAVYITNRLPCAAHPDKTPYEVCFGQRPDVSHYRVFGSKGFAHIDKHKRSKFDSKAFACMFLGYSDTTKGYRVLNLNSNKVEIVRTVKFQEVPTTKFVEVTHQYEPRVVFVDDDEVPATPSIATGATRPVPQEMDTDDDMFPETEEEKEEEPAQTSVPDPTFDVDDEFMGSDIDDVEEERIVPRGRIDPESPTFGPSDAPALPPSYSQALVPVERSDALVPRERFDSFSVGDNDSDDQPSSPKRLRLTYEEAHVAFEAPSTYQQALNSSEKEEWKKAIKSELQALNSKQTWTLVKRDPSQKVIGSKWVFAIKRDEHGNIQRYKARLVALGYRQTQGVDYSETYSPVANMNSVRTFLALSSQKGYFIQQFDVDTAFLNGKLEEDIYMLPPEGTDVNDDEVCKLNNSLYGLKQAAAVWYKTISKVFVKKLKFRQCASDPCIFVHADGTWVVLYVDDMLISAKLLATIKNIQAELSKEFTLKDLGQTRFILGMEVQYNRTARSLKLSQAASITKMVEKFGQVDAKPVVSPSVIGEDLTKSTDIDPSMADRPFRSLVGSLLYVATCTRPDIAYMVNQLSRHLERPTQQHWKAAIRVLRYLKSTKSVGIQYGVESKDVKVSAFSDANWASNKDDRRSVSGVMVMINGSPVIFKSRTQHNVSLSTAEAEYVALSLCVQEVLWLKHLLGEMGVEIKAPVPVFEDNQGAIAIAKNEGYQSRAKHIDIRYHFIREHVKAKVIDLQYVESKSQQADFLTKPIATKQFQHLLTKSKIQ